MGVRKQYEPHCPAADCSGGYAPRLHQVTAVAVHLPAEILERRGPNDSIYQCSYCQFIWFQRSSLRPGFDPTPAGYYDNFRWPNEFHPVAKSFSIRRENTRTYWEEYSETLRKRRERRRR